MILNLIILVLAVFGAAMFVGWVHANLTEKYHEDEPQELVDVSGITEEVMENDTKR